MIGTCGMFESLKWNDENTNRLKLVSVKAYQSELINCKFINNKIFQYNVKS